MYNERKYYDHFKREQNQLYQHIRQLCKEQDRTITDLERAIRIPVGTIDTYKTYFNPQTDRLLKIASYFRVTVGWLLGETDERN